MVPTQTRVRLGLEILVANAVASSLAIVAWKGVAPSLSLPAVLAMLLVLLIAVTSLVLFLFVSRTEPANAHWNIHGVPTNRLLTVTLSICVLGLGVCGSVGVAMLLQREQDRKLDIQSEDLAKLAQKAITSQVQRPVYGLNGARATIMASDEVTREEFARYIGGRDLETEFPGVEVFGLITSVPRERVDAFDADLRAAGVDRLTIAPAPPQDHHLFVNYAEPASSGIEMLGHDLSGIQTVQDGIAFALERGDAALTDPFVIPGMNETGMMWLLPVLSEGASPHACVHERIEGVLFAVLNIEGVRAPVGALLGSSARFELLDSMDGGTVLISNMGHWPDGHGNQTNQEADRIEHQSISAAEPLEIGGQQWVVRVSPIPSGSSRFGSAQSEIVGVVGSLLSIAVAALIFQIGGSQNRAQTAARMMTSDIRRLSLVAKYTTNAVVITDAQGRVEWVNESFTRITGYSAEEIIGERPGPLLQCEKTDPNTIRQIREAVWRGSGYRGTILNRSKDGREYWLDLDIQPVRNAQGELTGFVAVESDITDRKEIEQQLVNAKSSADAANEAKSRFLSSMSHEIRTPLNGIIGFADLLQQGADEGDESLRAEWIGVIHGSGTHLLSLLNDVLDLSKLDAEQTDIAVHPCNPRKAISEAVLLLNSRADEKGIALEVAIDEDVPCEIRSDATRIKQMVMNLVSNAVKFTEEGGVTVRVRYDDRNPGSPRIRVEIRDTGIGMTEEQMSNLFAPFQQADHTISERFGGTGLGLSISRQLAQRLGGDITVESSPGEGSTFTLTLDAIPLLPGESVRDSADISVPLDGPGVLTGKRVLVTDDVEANRRVCSLFLTRAGADVVVATDGLEAVEHCEHEQFDLILMDVQMPVMDGLEASSRIRDMGYKGPILALTAFSAGGERSGCMAAGMDDFLTKPIDSKLLLESSANWIRRSAGISDTLSLADTGEGAQDDEMDETLAEVALDWLRQVPERLESAQRAIDEQDLESAAKIAHALLGSGGTLGLWEFNKPAARMENAAIAHDEIKTRQALRDVHEARKNAEQRLQQRFAA